MDFFPSLGYLGEDLVMRFACHRACDAVIAEPATACGEITHVSVEHGHAQRGLFNEVLQRHGPALGHTVPFTRGRKFGECGSRSIRSSFCSAKRLATSACVMIGRRAQGNGAKARVGCL